MEKIREALWADYNEINDKMKVITPDDGRYKDLLEEKDKVRNELIKTGQVIMETDVKKSQIEAEDKRDKIRNKITIGTFVVSTCISVYAIVRTFKFDQTGTVTSTLGRNILNGVLPKFKR